jgi:hypothetical protein
MKRYPQAERARGFLLGAAWATGVDLAEIDAEDAEGAEGTENADE